MEQILWVLMNWPFGIPLNVWGAWWLSESNISLNTTNTSLFKIKNESFYPIHSRTNSLEVFQERIEEDLSQLHSPTNNSRPVNNLNVRERIALRELSNIQDIIIRQADKGGAIIILDKDVYKQEHFKLLSDTNTYRCLSMDPTSDFRNVLVKHVERGVTMGVLNRKQADS